MALRVGYCIGGFDWLKTASQFGHENLRYFINMKSLKLKYDTLELILIRMYTSPVTNVILWAIQLLRWMSNHSLA